MKSGVKSDDDKIKIVWEKETLYTRLVYRFLRYDLICKGLLLSSLLGMCSFPNMFFITTLIRYNSHTLQFTHLKGEIQWFCNIVTSCATTPTVSLRTLSSPQKETLCPLAVTSHFTPMPPSPEQPLVNRLLIATIGYLLWSFKWIVQYQVFHDWFSKYSSMWSEKFFSPWELTVAAVEGRGW